jgi:hypothetical protein
MVFLILLPQRFLPVYLKKIVYKFYNFLVAYLDKPHWD